MIRVVLATGLYPPDIGGPATYAKMLHDDLSKHDIDLIVVPFSLVRSYPKLIRHFVYGWKLWTSTRQTSLIYALDPISVGLPAVLIAKIRRLKFILRVGGDYAWEQGCVRFGITQTLDSFILKQTKHPLPVRLLSVLQSWVAQQAVVVVSPSNYLKRIITQWGVDPESVRVIYSVLFPLIPTQTKNQTLQELSVGSPVLLTSGRLVPWKGIDALIEVVQKLIDSYPNITLLVAGDGPEKVVLEAKVAKYNLQNHIKFLGRLNKTELANIKLAADVFILNTAYEGLSHELLEVMDLCVPIVTTNVGGNPELLSNGVDAALVPFDDTYALEESCIQIIENPDIRERFIRFAKKRTADFNRKQAVTATASLLKKVSSL